MSILDVAHLLASNKTLHRSFRECRHCLKDVERAGRALIVSPPGTPRAFTVTGASFPLELHLPQRNFFSTLFQAVYGLLDIPLERRLLYGRINYLFRIWVTSADNLLDGEDKIALPVKLPEDSRVMRQVVAIMAADRILTLFLDEAVASKVITVSQAKSLADGTLQVLLPSAAEEASEERGITKRPPPEYVLGTIHQLKTAILFHLPLFGPTRIDKGLDPKVLLACREGLGDFGLGCQILDDIRDMARDHVEARHNYVLSWMAHESPAAQRKLKAMNVTEVDRVIFHEFPDDSAAAARLGRDHLLNGLHRLNDAGLGFDDAGIEPLVMWMFKALDIEAAGKWVK